MCAFCSYTTGTMTVVLFLFFTLPFLTVHAAPCACKFINFKFRPCANSNNVFYLNCSTPYMDEDCAGGGCMCSGNSTLGPITSAELEINGMVSMLPLAFTDNKACRGTRQVKPNQLFGEVIASVNKLCVLVGDPEIKFHIPLNEEERRLLPAIAGHLKVTVKGKKLNGDRNNHVCYVLETDLRCKNALSVMFKRN